MRSCFFAGLPFDSDWTQPRLQHLLPVFLDELALAGREDMQLPLPSDRRLKTLDPGYCRRSLMSWHPAAVRGKDDNADFPAGNRYELPAVAAAVAINKIC